MRVALALIVLVSLACTGQGYGPGGGYDGECPDGQTYCDGKCYAGECKCCGDNCYWPLDSNCCAVSGACPSNLNCCSLEGTTEPACCTDKQVCCPKIRTCCDKSLGCGATKCGKN